MATAQHNWQLRRTLAFLAIIVGHQLDWAGESRRWRACAEPSYIQPSI